MTNHKNSGQDRNMFRSALIPLLILVLLAFSCTGNKAERYYQMDKIDAHVHIRTTDPAIMEFVGAEGFKLLTINTRSNSRKYIDESL